MLRLKLRGMFYNAFGDDARVLSQVTGYKVKESGNGNCKAAFPCDDNTLNKVCDNLDGCNISYLITTKEDVVRQKEFLNDRYDEYLSYFDDSNIVKKDISVVDISDMNKSIAGKTHKTLTINIDGTSITDAMLRIHLELVNMGDRIKDIHNIEMHGAKNGEGFSLSCKLDI